VIHAETNWESLWTLKQKAVRDTHLYKLFREFPK